MLPQLTTLRLPNTTPHPDSNPRLRRYLLTTQRLLHRTTSIRITTPRFQFTTPKSTLPPATSLKLLFTKAPRPEYYTTPYASTQLLYRSVEYYSAPSYYRLCPELLPTLPRVTTDSAPSYRTVPISTNCLWQPDRQAIPINLNDMDHNRDPDSEKRNLEG